MDVIYLSQQWSDVVVVLVWLPPELGQWRSSLSEIRTSPVPRTTSASSLLCFFVFLDSFFAYRLACLLSLSLPLPYPNVFYLSVAFLLALRSSIQCTTNCYDFSFSLRTIPSSTTWPYHMCGCVHLFSSFLYISDSFRLVLLIPSYAWLIWTLSDS